LKLLLLHHTNDLKVIRALRRASALLRHKLWRHSLASVLSGATRNRGAATIKLTTARRGTPAFPTHRPVFLTHRPVFTHALE
jgi:hypothetical protein